MKQELDKRIYFDNNTHDAVKVLSGTYKGRDYVISSVAGYYPCAYVESNVNYYELNPYIIPEVHCGFTYFGGLAHIKGLDETTQRRRFVGWDYGHIGDYNRRFPNEGDTSYTLADIVSNIQDVIDILISTETAIKEQSSLITDEEKECLKAVIAPYKNQVKYIVKTYSGEDYIKDISRIEQLDICIENFLGKQIITLPKFIEGTAYRGMKIDKKYNLEDVLY